MWCFEQEQSLGGSNVSTNVRMTAIKLRSGGLFVHAPIAATKSDTCSSLLSCLQSGSFAVLKEMSCRPLQRIEAPLWLTR